MTGLSDEQVGAIADHIKKGGVTNAELIDDLLDHYCCFIENEMALGTGFEIAYQKAFKAITPNGTLEIQEELYLVLNLKQTIMKRFTYSSSFIAAFCISAGMTLKVQHWTGGRQLLLAGLLALIVTCITLLSNSLKHVKNHSLAYNTRVLTGFTSGLLIAIGGIIKMLQWPGSDIVMVTGLMVLNFVFLPLFFYHLYKQATQNTTNLAGTDL